MQVLKTNAGSAFHRTLTTVGCWMRARTARPQDVSILIIPPQEVSFMVMTFCHTRRVASPGSRYRTNFRLSAAECAST